MRLVIRGQTLNGFVGPGKEEEPSNKEPILSYTKPEYRFHQEIEVKRGFKRSWNPVPPFNYAKGRTTVWIAQTPRGRWAAYVSVAGVSTRSSPFVDTQDQAIDWLIQMIDQREAGG